MSNTLTLQLDLIAAKAAALSEQIKRGATWPGDVSDGLAEIDKALQTAYQQPEAQRHV